MKSSDILDAIGKVDDECVRKAKEKKKSNKRVWITVGSLAACMVLLFMAPFIYIAFQGANSAAPEGAGGQDLAVDSEYVWIYYVDGDEINRTSQYLPLSAEQIFYAWREQNNIGDEVAFIKVKIDSNSKTTESEFDGEGVVKHEIGDYFVYNLTISKRIEEYYHLIDSELLLESLKQTMTGYSELEYDEYNLILE